jgi:cell division protease FtsH
MFSSDKPTVTFADVAGVDEAKAELAEVVEFLKEPDKFTSLGARIPKGVLVVGPPGTGKTLLARAVAGEANVPFFSISGSEFVEMFVGVGASRVRDLFDQAKRNSPCIVFVDEIDAVGRHRGAGLGGSHDEREQTLNQILVEMDGFDTDTKVIIVAATNRPDILDPALMRPGRFDRRVILDRPDMNGRKQILGVHVKGKPIAKETNLELIAKQTPGFSGADIENLVNEAAILAARRNKKEITTTELKESIEKVIVGPERRSRLIGEEEKKIVAYHEAGHAIVLRMLPNCDPVHKVSIISRGMAMGYTMHLPDDDRYLGRRAKFMDDLAGLLGGRVAEEIVFGDVTTGAANDLERVTDTARAMVTRYGMSEKLGPRTFGNREELVFLGREISEQRNYSEEVAQQIDQEVKQIINTAYTKAKEILTQYRAKLDALADQLIRDETIEGPEFEALFSDVPAPQRPTKPAPKPEPATRTRAEPDAPRLAPMPAPSPA